MEDIMGNTMESITGSMEEMSKQLPEAGNMNCCFRRLCSGRL